MAEVPEEAAVREAAVVLAVDSAVREAAEACAADSAAWGIDRPRLCITIIARMVTVMAALGALGALFR